MRTERKFKNICDIKKELPINFNKEDNTEQLCQQSFNSKKNRSNFIQMYPKEILFR